MKYLVASWLFLFLSFLSHSAFAQFGAYSALSIPDTLQKNANEVVRIDHMHFKVESPKEAVLKVKYAVTLLNGNSRANKYAVSYSAFEKINSLSAKVYDAMGKEIRKVKAKDFIDQSSISSFSIYEDDRLKYIELHHNSYPYTVEYEYTKTYKRIPYYPSSYMQSYGTSVEQLSFVVETPQDLKIRYKCRNTNLEPEIRQENNNMVYTWTAKHLPALKYENMAPYSEKIRPAILVAPTKFQFGKYEGDLSTWESFGKFMYELNKGRDQLSPEMANKVKEMTANASSNAEKIAILYQYLQDNMRYVSVQLGISGWQTFDARYVEKNKYGDCKALSNFMKSMLNEVGVESYATLIYSSRSNKIEIDEDFATPAFANHVILHIPSEATWLECTSNDYPPNYLGASNSNRQALMVTPEGGKIVWTPVFDPDQNKRVNQAEILINAQGAATIKQRIERVGPRHDYYRYLSNNLSPEDLEKEFLENSNLPAFTIDKLELNNHQQLPQTQINYDISVMRYASKAGRRIFVPLNKLNPFDVVPKQLEKRIHPIHIKNQYKEEDTYTYLIPGDYKVESIPQESMKLESDFGKYEVTIQVEENKIIYRRTLEIREVELPADRYNDLRDFYKEIAKTDDMKAVLVKKRT